MAKADHTLSSSLWIGCARKLTTPDSEVREVRAAPVQPAHINLNLKNCMLAE